MIDWKTKSAKEMQAAFRAQSVEIAGGRWPIWPTVSRISIGSRQDMEGFFKRLQQGDVGKDPVHAKAKGLPFAREPFC